MKSNFCQMRFSSNCFSANLMVGSACRGILVFRRFRYIPAIMGFSALLAVSSSMMLASVHTSTGVSCISAAFFSRSPCQKCWCSFSIRCIRASILMFQYTS